LNILYVLIPLSLVLMGGALWALFWAIDHGQFDDLDTPGRSILEDDEAGVSQ
jgi:cbb3-type cytochrome oxidase maturation protein